MIRIYSPEAVDTAIDIIDYVTYNIYDTAEVSVCHYELRTMIGPAGKR